MNRRGTRKYIDDLLAGRRPRPFNPDDFEAEQIRTAIELRAAPPGADQPPHSSSLLFVISTLTTTPFRRS